MNVVEREELHHAATRARTAEEHEAVVDADVERVARAASFYLESALNSLSLAYTREQGVRLSKKEVIALSLALGHEPR